MGIFKVASKVNLDDCKIGDVFEESDFSTVTPSGTFIQMTFQESGYIKRLIPLSNGFWKIDKSATGPVLVPAELANNNYLDGIGNLPKLEHAMDCFFTRLHVYKDLGIEIPKRAALLYGPAGTGKTTSILKTAFTYQQSAAIIIWETSRFDAMEAKVLFESLDYSNVERLIVVVEDLGGVEIQDRRIASSSSLLSLLDNSQKTFKTNTFIIATTNYPEMFMENLTNRPDRFDDKIEIGHLKVDQQTKLLEFFLKEPVPESIISLLKSKGSQFTPAHLRELVVKSKIYNQSLDEVFQNMVADIKKFKVAFTKQKTSMGLMGADDYE